MIQELKKKEEQLENVYSKALEAINTDTAIVYVQQPEIEIKTAHNEGDDVVRKTEVDEMLERGREKRKERVGDGMQ